MKKKRHTCHPWNDYVRKFKSKFLQCICFLNPTFADIIFYVIAQPENTLLPENIQSTKRVHNLLLKSSVEVGRVMVDNLLEIAAFLNKTLKQVSSYKKAFGINFQKGMCIYYLLLFHLQYFTSFGFTFCFVYFLAVATMNKISRVKEDMEAINSQLEKYGKNTTLALVMQYKIYCLLLLFYVLYLFYTDTVPFDKYLEFVITSLDRIVTTMKLTSEVHGEWRNLSAYFIHQAAKGMNKFCFVFILT